MSKLTLILLVAAAIFYSSGASHEIDIINECEKTGYADISLWTTAKIKCSLEK